MALEKNLLIVVDPAMDTQPAVDRVISLMELGSSGYKPEVTLLVAVDFRSLDSEGHGLYREDDFITGLADRLRAVGLNPKVRISWSREWADNILYTAEQTGATSLMLSHPGPERSKAMTDDFWHLIRNTSIPVGIYQNQDKPKFETILASINIQDQSEQREVLNRKIVAAGRAVAETYGAQLHLANAYGDSSSYPDRGRLVNLTNLPNENIHLQAGPPEEAIAEITRKLNPDVIIIGATHRRGFKAAMRGRQMARIFGAVDKDIFIIV